MRAALSLSALSSFLLLLFATPTFAGTLPTPGKCMDKFTLPKDCQFVAEPGKVTLDVSASNGIHLYSNVQNVIFNSHVGLHRFVDSTSTQALFVPQYSNQEFFDFLVGADKIVSYARWDYAINNQYIPHATNFEDCSGALFQPTTPYITVSGSEAYSGGTLLNLKVFDGHTRLPKAYADVDVSVTVGQTEPGGPVEFIYHRTDDPRDCITDKEGNTICSTVSFLQAHQMTFHAVRDTRPGNFSIIRGIYNYDYVWSSDDPLVKLYVKVNEEDYREVLTCSDPNPPKIDGACGPASGSYSATAPALDKLCTSGDSTDPQGNSPWTWECKGVGTGAIDAKCSTGMKCVKVVKDSGLVTVPPSLINSEITYLLSGGGGGGSGKGGSKGQGSCGAPGGGGGSSSMNGTIFAAGGRGGFPGGAGLGDAKFGESGDTTSGTLSNVVGNDHTFNVVIGGGGGGGGSAMNTDAVDCTFGSSCGGGGGGAGVYGGGGGGGGGAWDTDGYGRGAGTNSVGSGGTGRSLNCTATSGNSGSGNNGGFGGRCLGFGGGGGGNSGMGGSGSGLWGGGGGGGAQGQTGGNGGMNGGTGGNSGGSTLARGTGMGGPLGSGGNGMGGVGGSSGHVTFTYYAPTCFW